MLKYILDKGFDVNLLNKMNGETALIRSVHYNMKEMVEFLLLFKPDLEIKSNYVQIKLKN